MTFEQARWRLQLLAELGVGTLLRENAKQEDARFTHLKDVTSGPR